MNRIIDICKDKINFPVFIVMIGVLIGIISLFSYLIPFTDDAFVVANNQTVAAEVSGYVSKIYVKNGQQVKQGQPLFQVYDEPYKLALAKSTASYEQAKSDLDAQIQQIEKDKSTLKTSQINLDKSKYEYSLKSNPLANNSVSALELKNAKYSVQLLEEQVSSDTTQLKIDQSHLKQKQQALEQAKASMNIDKINLDETTVRAGSDGVVDNMFISLGTPISQHQSLFSFINTDNWYVQANMNETDLRKVRPGDKALIWLRMYGLDHVFHGVIVNRLWATDRQNTTSRSQQQVISADNEWLNLPQRVPLLIEISDPDPQFPLNPGVSAYVYIQTK